MRHITLVGYRKALGTSITIPMEMLNAADLIRRIGGGGADGRLAMRMASLDGGNIALAAGISRGLPARRRLSTCSRSVSITPRSY